jgi:hypothetical protein
MAPRPTADRPPSGLKSSYWTHVWDHALNVLKTQGTWAWEQKPLLDEYVFALIAAEDAREGGLPTQWDRHTKRAAALADALVLTPAARRRHGIGADSVEESKQSKIDELAARRSSRAG